MRFGLRPGGAPTLRYPDLHGRFDGVEAPTLVEVAATVRAIRAEKGMVWVEGEPDSRSAGSFFKNPVVDAGRLEEIAAAGFWRIGLTGHASQTLAQAMAEQRLAIVLGAEGEGLRQNTEAHCDELARLPISAKVESLNVSNAAAIALYAAASRGSDPATRQP